MASGVGIQWVAQNVDGHPFNRRLTAACGLGASSNGTDNKQGTPRGQIERARDTPAVK